MIQGKDHWSALLGFVQWHRLRNVWIKLDDFELLITLRVGIEKMWYKNIGDTPLVSTDRGRPLAANDVEEKQHPLLRRLGPPAPELLSRSRQLSRRRMLRYSTKRSGPLPTASWIWFVGFCATSLL